MPSFGRLRPLEAYNFCNHIMFEVIDLVVEASVPDVRQPGIQSGAPHGSASIIRIAFALAYFVIPTDAIADWIPVSGLVDDGTVLAVTLAVV